MKEKRLILTTPYADVEIVIADKDSWARDEIKEWLSARLGAPVREPSDMWEKIGKYRSQLTRQLSGKFYHQQEKKKALSNELWERYLDKNLSQCMKEQLTWLNRWNEKWDEQTKRTRAIQEQILGELKVAEYRTKKTLPFARAGAKAKVSVKHLTYTEVSVKGDVIDEWYRMEIPNENFDEWIEQIKEGEWYEVVARDDYDELYYRSSTLDNAANFVQEYRYKPRAYFKILKVREIFE